MDNRIEEIRQALLKAGYSQTWIDSVFPDKRSGPDLVREQFISWLEAGECSHADTLALYDQLQQSREENERLRGLYERERDIAEQAQRDNERLLGELEQKQAECERRYGYWHEALCELEQVKAERDDYREVLEGYAIMKLDGARNILSRYTPKERGDCTDEQGD